MHFSPNAFPKLIGLVAERVGSQIWSSKRLMQIFLNWNFFGFQRRRFKTNQIAVTKTYSSRRHSACLVSSNSYLLQLSCHLKGLIHWSVLIWPVGKKIFPIVCFSQYWIFCSLTSIFIELNSLYTFANTCLLPALFFPPSWYLNMA